LLCAFQRFTAFSSRHSSGGATLVIEGSPTDISASLFFLPAPAARTAELKRPPKPSKNFQKKFSYFSRVKMYFCGCTTSAFCFEQFDTPSLSNERDHHLRDIKIIWIKGITIVLMIAL
jgi:hypothetical protein